jgi:regulator of cell morphogenesis and NO signaling
MSDTMTQTTVGRLVVERPVRARVFERFGIDYCCGGKKPLDQACRDKNLNPQDVLRELQQADADQPDSGRDWALAPLAELADQIEQTHHRYLKQELPPLDALVRKVASVHGEAHPELAEVRNVFIRLRAEMESHILREELVLFPLCRRIGAGLPPAFPGTVQNPISVMVREHEDAGDALARIRVLTKGYTPPEGACNSYRAMLARLAELEADLHQHVHKENNILFPRAVEAEARVRS